jgi:hypothetical protein
MLNVVARNNLVHVKIIHVKHYYYRLLLAVAIAVAVAITAAVSLTVQNLLNLPKRLENFV